MAALENQVDRHEYELTQLKTMIADSSNSLTECTKAMRDLTTQFAIYTERHDNTERTMAALSIIVSETTKLTNKNTIAIATMQPTVESVRGLLWKMVASVVTGVGGASIIVIALLK